MPALIDRVHELLSGQPSTDELEAVGVELNQRVKDLMTQASDVRARIERPRDVEDYEQAEQALKRLQVEDGIINRLLGQLPRAKTRAAAREAIASAETDRKALANAVTQAEQLKRQYENALAQAQGLAEQMRRALEAVRAPDAQSIDGGEAVGADHATADRLAELTLDLSGIHATTKRDSFIRKIVQPEPLSKAS